MDEAVRCVRELNVDDWDRSIRSENPRRPGPTLLRNELFPMAARPAEDLEDTGIWEADAVVELLFTIGLAARELGANLDASPGSSVSNLRFGLVFGGSIFVERPFKDAWDNSTSVLGGLSLLGLVCKENRLG